jgi:hypothetical protein
MDVQKQNLKQLDTTARTWSSSAGFTHEHGNTLTTAVTRVVESTKGINESQLQAYGESEFVKLERAYGSELDSKLQLAGRMIAELDAKQPILKQLLKTLGSATTCLWFLL